MKSLLWGAVVAAMLASASCQTDCSQYFTVLDETCVTEYSANCKEITISEDCMAGTGLIQATNPIYQTSGCEILDLESQTTVNLKRAVDAETDAEFYYCSLFQADEIVKFGIENVNEFNPDFVNKTPIFDVTVLEGGGPETITNFFYQDKDKGETETLQIEMLEGDPELFEVEKIYSEDVNVMTFDLKTRQSLDFETMMYYRLVFNITSKDAQQRELAATQTILVFVEDFGDNAPTFISAPPSVQLNECGVGESVFTVKAIDRDVDIQNDIRYSITGGNDNEFFTIGDVTGEVTTKKEIDREELESTTFALTIMAKEVDQSGSDVPLPNNDTRVINVYIVDLNDNSPTFNDQQYTVEIDELVEDLTLTPVIPISVTDMDENLNGTFRIESDQPSNLGVIPSQGTGNVSVTLKALWRGEDTAFDYEKTQEDLVFTLTATELADPSHIATATLVVKLRDINDNSPNFDESEYLVDVEETAGKDFVVTNVTATDADISDEFGTPSIRYESKCQELTVDAESGSVSLAREDVLNFESSGELRCTIEARDGADSSGNSNTALVVITVIDVVDEQPLITPPDEQRIYENVTAGSEVGEVTAEDKDADADIEFYIDWDATTALFEGNTVATDLVRGWFETGDVVKNGIAYSTKVLVLAEVDREVADEVRLSVVVRDKSTESGSDQSVATFVINIDDVIDEPPEFDEDYTQLSVKEGLGEGMTIYVLQVSDPDLYDEVLMTISDDSYVTVEMQDDFKTWRLTVSQGVEIDREEIEEILVTVTITDSVGLNNQQEITITVEDLNDNPPYMVTCNTNASVSEHAPSGTHLSQVSASDDDIGAHGQVRYILVNNQIDAKTPFAVNSQTGEVTVFLEEGRVLDREREDEWELTIEANDGCEESDSECEVNKSDPCKIIVTVTDENDNAPDKFEVNPPILSNTFYATENMKMGETLSDNGMECQIRAVDDDEPGTDNTKITYSVEWVRRSEGEEDLELFEAVNIAESWTDNDVCLLKATKDLTMMRGSYEINVTAQDSGEPQMDGSKVYYLEIGDYNDNTPTFQFIGCLNKSLEITMEEKYYMPDDEVECTTSEGGKLTILVKDDDVGLNKDFVCSIDYDNSSALTSDGGEGQLRSFVFSRDRDQCKLYVTDVIDRQKGRRYNLSLHVEDKGTPKLESWETLHVIVTDAFESPPFFCTEGLCEQTLTMIENDPDVTATFMKGTDTDNIDFDPNDPNTYQNVYYDIVGGHEAVFQLGTSDRMENFIKLRNRPEGLDRENQAEYQLYIDVTNDANLQGDIPEILPRNYTLYLTINVEDENDNTPYFDKSVIIASFTQNDNDQKPIAVIEANDRDLIGSLSYKLGEFSWSEGVVPPAEEPFKLSTNPEGVTQLLLNFNPIGFSSGFCTFDIEVDDGIYKNSTQGKVYVITKEYQLPVTFNNDKTTVSTQTQNIEDIFTSVYLTSCVVDSTEEVEGEAVRAVYTAREGGKTVVYMHFIDDQKNEPVPKDTIIEQTTDVAVIKELRNKLGELSLNLVSVGDAAATDDTEGNAVLVLQVLLGVVSLVLGSLVFLLLTAYCLRTRSLERQVKVLSTNTFGSKGSDLNRAGLDLEVVPGSNMFKGDGANPMYNMSEAELRNDDTSSIGSGDSVLVGVEDNPEFKNYLSSRMEAAAEVDNSPFGRTIDQVSAPTGFGETQKSNPLMGLGGGDDVDLSDALRDFELTTRRTSSVSNDSFGMDNPNFTFGN